MASLVLAGILLLMPREPTAAAAPLVEGVVSAPGGRPVKDAAVVVHPRVMGRGEVPATSRTDENGRFRVAVTSAAEYAVYVDAAGFAPASRLDARPGVPVSVTLEEGRTLAGTVRDAVTGRAIPGARVSADAPVPFLPTDLQFGRREAVTNAKGSYELKHVPARLEAVDATARGYARGRTRVAPSTARADLTLQDGASLAGTVRSARGAPVAGAVVFAQAFRSHGSPGSHGRAQTGPDGRFEVLGLDRGVFHVAAYHPGFAPAFVPPVRVDGPAPIDLVLKEPASVVGRLVDENGNGVGGRIWIEDVQGGFAVPGDVLRAAAGADGRFGLRDLPAGTHRAGISARGHTDRSIEFHAREGNVTDVGDVLLETGAVIRGRLRDAKGAPVAGARIQALPADSGRGFAHDLTDATGAFVLAGLGEGRYRLSAVVGDALRATREAETGDEPIEWTLEATGTIVGSVVDAAGRPVASFHVAARPSGGAADWFVPRATGTASFRIEQVSPGRYLLQVTADGHADAAVNEVVVTAERTTDVGSIRLGTAGIVRGTVVDAAGEPVPGAAVTVWSQRDVAAGNLGDRKPQSQTGPDGSFEVSGLNPGSARVVASHPRLGHGQVTGLEVDPGAGPTVAQVVLAPGGRVRGTMRKRGEGVSATVSAMSFSGLHHGEASALTDGDGAFVLENLPPGETWIQFLPLNEPDMQGLPEKRVLVREGQTSVVDVDIRDVLVTGRVTRAGAFAAGLRVAFDREGGRSGWRLREGQAGPQRMIASSGSDGEYALLVPQPGAYTARVETVDYVVLHRRAVTIPDTAQHRVDLEFTSSAVTGVLVDEATQQPIANGTISAVAEDGDWRPEVRTGSDGRFEIALEPGTYLLRAHAAGFASVAKPLPVGAGGVTDQRVALSRGWSIRGRVLDTRGQGIGGVQVFATAPDKEDAIAHANTAADGAFELSGLDEPRYNLFAGSELAGYATLTGVGADAGEPMLSLRPPGRVRVTVNAAGAPVPRALVVISGVEGARVFGLSTFFALTDGAGVVEMAVPRGAIELTAHDGDGRRTGSAAVVVPPGELVAVVIAVAPGE